MKIISAKFIKGVVGSDTILSDGTPQIAFIGRSNAGKSSLLNSLTNSRKLAITSDTPGRTREINVFMINESHYFIDLPGYGYARAGARTLDKLGAMISWYLFDSDNNPTVVLLIDSLVGLWVGRCGRATVSNAHGQARRSQLPKCTDTTSTSTSTLVSLSLH